MCVCMLLLCCCNKGSGVVRMTFPLHGRYHHLSSSIQYLFSILIFLSPGSTVVYRTQPPMDYNSVPTAVFTPMEMGTVGLTEEAAIAAHDEHNIEVYHSGFTPLEYAPLHLEGNPCSAKVIVNKEDGKVLGMHIASPNAGEVIQGFGVAFKKGITYDVSDLVVLELVFVSK